jgi:SAM-dependent methyltransferase/uncharacterized protein YbaR (Trm112 family)
LLRRLMDILCCPLCRTGLRLRVREQGFVKREAGPFPGCRDSCEYRSLSLDSANRETAHSHCSECYRHDVREGVLLCGSGHEFQIARSVPRFNPGWVERKRTKATFDVEWSAFRYGDRIYGHSQEEELQDFFLRTTMDREFLHEKTVLDAGCGIGRLSQSVARLSRELVGMDFSTGAEEASLRNETAGNVHIVQGDILNPPFKGSSFDLVYAKGVLHYVPDVKGSLKALAEVVKPGGSLSVTINPRLPRAFESFSNGLRRLTLRLPMDAVYLMSHACVPLLEIPWRWSGVKRRRIEWKERAHMIFNWLSAEQLNTSSERQMREWLAELGFDRITLSDLPVGIMGRKKDPGIQGLKS